MLHEKTGLLIFGSTLKIYWCEDQCTVSKVGKFSNNKTNKKQDLVKLTYRKWNSHVNDIYTAMFLKALHIGSAYSVTVKHSNRAVTMNGDNTIRPAPIMPA